LIWLGFISSLSVAHAGSEVGFSQTRSSAAIANRVKLGLALGVSHKLSFVARRTVSLADVDDRDASSFRLGYRYRFEGGSHFSFDLRRSDESYFYESSGGSLRFSWALLESTRVTFAVDGSRRSYMPSESEQFLQSATSFGVEQDLGESFVVGVVSDRQFYAATSGQTRRALQGQTVLNTDIGTYVGTLLSGSIAGFVEYTPWDWLSFGLGHSVDSYAYRSGQTATSEIFVDTQIIPSLTLGLYFSRGRSDFSTELSDSYGGGVIYGF
jgi:hypothetical protein